MTDTPSHLPSPEDEIVDLDDFPKTKSVLLGAGLVVLLNLLVGVIGFQFLCCMNLALGGFTVVSHFTKSNGISVTSGTGAKLGLMGTLIGSLVVWCIALLVMPNKAEQIEQQRDQVIQQFQEPGNEQAIEMVERILRPENAGFFVLADFAMLVLGAVLLGSLGGMIGASLSRKGPEAR